jgi:RNA polymerase sigma factor (sigma-70 family)
MTSEEALDAVREYAQTGSQHAFARIVRAHVDLVYGAALRQVHGDVHLAEDVTQAVFIVLSRKAKSIRDKTVISGWLVKTARFCAHDALKRHYRQSRHEREAAAMRPTSYQPSTASALELNELLPHLDEALSHLPTRDRDAIVLRFLEQRSMRQVSKALGTTEEAAKKRVARAVGKLRHSFIRTGSPLSVPAVEGALRAYVPPEAPPALATTVLASIFSAGKASVASVAIADGAMQMMRSTKWMLTAVLGGTAVLIVLIPLIWWQVHLTAPTQSDTPTQQTVSK